MSIYTYKFELNVNELDIILKSKLTDKCMCFIENKLSINIHVVISSISSHINIYAKLSVFELLTRYSDEAQMNGKIKNGTCVIDILKEQYDGKEY